MYEELQLCWGDMHLNFHHDQMSMIDRTFAAARSHLDFFPIAYYPFSSYKTPEGFAVETVGQRDIFLEDWVEVLAAVRRYNDPGRFVTFAGYEWHGKRRHFGDHNVYYFDEGVLSAAETLPELYAHLRTAKGLAIPHHTGYLIGERGKDWDYYDNGLSPFVEIFSDHGSSEGFDTPFPLNRVSSMGPRVSGGTVRDGLLRGYRLGIIASGDNHSGFPGVWGNGLVGVWAPELTRESLWEAFLSRRVYGVTGDRIRLAFALNGQPMGSVVQSQEPVMIKAHIVGWHAIDRVELLRNERVLYTYCHSGTWDSPQSDGEMRLKIRIDFGWGPSSWYGLVTTDKIWQGQLRLDGGRLLAVQGGFSCLGQSVEKVSERECTWQLTTKPRPEVVEKTSEVGWAGGVGWHNLQSLIFELEASPADRIHLTVDSESVDFSVEEALQGSRVWALMEGSRAIIKEQFGLSPGDIECDDMFYHNAHKVKIHVAIPEAGYTVPFEFVDESALRGWNWYRLRISQLNGQMAWSSPIWLDARQEGKNIKNPPQ